MEKRKVSSNISPVHVGLAESSILIQMVLLIVWLALTGLLVMSIWRGLFDFMILLALGLPSLFVFLLIGYVGANALYYQALERRKLAEAKNNLSEPIPHLYPSSRYVWRSLLVSFFYLPLCLVLFIILISSLIDSQIMPTALAVKYDYMIIWLAVLKVVAIPVAWIISYYLISFPIDYLLGLLPPKNLKGASHVEGTDFILSLSALGLIIVAPLILITLLLMRLDAPTVFYYIFPPLWMYLAFWLIKRLFSVPAEPSTLKNKEKAK